MDNFPIKIADKNFLFVILESPAAMLIAKAGVKGKATISTKFEKEIVSIFFFIFFACLIFLFLCFFKYFSNFPLKKYRKKEKESKQPMHVEIQDKIKPKTEPKEVTFKAINTPNGNIGIMDSKIIKTIPEIGPIVCKSSIVLLITPSIISICFTYSYYNIE